jgi:biopolymer transport protein ExbB/TolQ
MSYDMREPPIQHGYYRPGPLPPGIPPLVLILAVIGGMTVLCCGGVVLTVPMSIARSMHPPHWQADPWGTRRSHQEAVDRAMKQMQDQRKSVMEDMKKRQAETHARLEQRKQESQERMEEMRRNSREQIRQMQADMQRQQQELHQQLEQTREMTRAASPFGRPGAVP